jgi:hypothetical protein
MTTENLFGCLPRTTICGAGSFAASTVEPLPRSEWRPWDLTTYVHHIYQQRGGTCVAHGACQALMMVRAINGQPPKVLNPYVLYGQKSQRINSGLPIEDGLDVLRKVGTVDLDFYPTLGNISPRAWPDGWEKAAKKYKAIEWDDLPGDSTEVFDRIWTIGQRGFPSVIGSSCVGGPHCMAVAAGEFVGSSPALVFVQSWGEGSTNYGRPGFWRYPERSLGDMAYYGAWALRSVTYTGDAA